MDPNHQYGPPNATAAAIAINKVPADGSMVYVYLGLGSDMAVIDGIKVSGLQVQQLSHIYTITNCCLPLSALGS
jgi:hypothetical protein